MKDGGHRQTESILTPNQLNKLTDTSIENETSLSGPCAISKLYYDNCVDPLLKVLQSLTLDSYNISNSANNLSNIYAAKNSKIKDAVHLVDKLNDECEDVFKVLEDNIDNLLKLYRNNP